MTNSGVLTPAARVTLEECAKRVVTVGSRDKRWQEITELQRAGFVRLVWTATKVARIDVTDAGRAELAKVQS